MTHPAAALDAHLASPRKILSAFSVASAGTLLATVLSVGTNKIIAVMTGAEGVALMGLYRGLGAFILGAVTSGSNLLVMQKVSAARSESERSDLISATALLTILQGLIIFLAAILAPDAISRSLFGSQQKAGGILEVQIVLGMTFLNLATQAAIAILKGQPDVKPVTILQVATSTASILLIFPLLQLGRVGLAINVGSGSAVGACLGIFFIFKLFRPKFNEKGLKERWTLLTSAGTSPLWLIAHSVGLSAGMLSIQSLINRRYGLEALGYFTASMLIIDTATMVLMSSARTYILPALGRLESMATKEALFRRMFTLLLAANTAAALALILGAPLILRILFSGQLVGGTEFLAAVAFSLIEPLDELQRLLLHRGYPPLRHPDLSWIISLAHLSRGTIRPPYLGGRIYSICGVLGPRCMPWSFV